ncbi:conserved Plasmodium protein, unknown function [Plasmodium vivax]|uniref:Uncharacterized protein n=1 Tax=Plasmodium vivax TaxID=5855 RepID=A0A1G4H6C8_PLAVI|nr:conserved Plasmodium protein, unknown function [Plasmodium vivax]
MTRAAMETKKRGTKLLCCALGALAPAYWLHHRRASTSQRGHNGFSGDLESVKKLKMNSPLCHIPLIILSIYDGYFYESKVLRRIHNIFRERSSGKAVAPFPPLSTTRSTSRSTSASAPPHPPLLPPHGGNTTREEGRDGPNYHFLMHSEKSLFNKMYFYELVLDKSIKYAVISPQLSFYILRQLSQHVVNLNTRLYHEEEFSLHREKRGGDRSLSRNRGSGVANWVRRLPWGGERSNSRHGDIGSGSDAGGEDPHVRKKPRRGEAKGNLYERYGIHKYEWTYSQPRGGDTTPSPQQDQVSINLLYLLNKAYDDVNRICIDTDANIFVSLYTINILKFICYKSYRHVLVNSSLVGELERGNRTGGNGKWSSLVDYVCAFFAGSRAAQEGRIPLSDADRYLFCGEADGGGERGHSASGLTGGLPSGLTSGSPIAPPPPAGAHKRDGQRDEAQQNGDGHSDQSVMGQGKANQTVGAATSRNVATPRSAATSNTHGGEPHQREDTQERPPHNYVQCQGEVNEQMKILNDLYLILYLRLLLECCIKLVSIKKNLLVLEERVKFEKGNKIFYLSTSDAIESLKVHFLKRFRRGEEKRGLRIFFRPYGSARGCAPPGKPAAKRLKTLPIWYSTDAQPTAEPPSSPTWKIALRGHLKRAKTYMNRKLFHLKKNINYYVVNVDEAITNKYYKRVYKKNLKRVKEHLRENTQKEIDLGRYHEMYYNIVANLSGILSFASAVDERNEVHRILSLYSTGGFYQYNYLNEHDSLFFKNGVSRYLRRLGDEWSTSSERREGPTRGESSPSFYYTNDIYLLLLLYTQRIKKCLNVFSYIYSKNHFSRYCSLCCIFRKLNFVLLSTRSSSHWVANAAFLLYHNWFACFSFFYFFCAHSYVAFFLLYQLSTFPSVRYFGILADPGLSLYFVRLYCNARAVCGS